MTRLENKLTNKSDGSTDLSNDSYSTVNMGLEDGASPHSGRGSYLHGSASPPPYLSSHSPTPMGGRLSGGSGAGGGGGGHQYAGYSDNIVYTSLGGSGGNGSSVGGGGIGSRHSTSNMLAGLHNSNNNAHGHGASDDMSNDSSPTHGYPDFPPSPDSWLGDATNNATTNATTTPSASNTSVSAVIAAAVSASGSNSSTGGHY